MLIKQTIYCDTDDCTHYDAHEKECGKGSIIIQEGCCCDYEKKQDTKEKIVAKIGSISTSYLRPSAYLTWDVLQNMASERLSLLTGRNILTESKREEHYYWGFYILKTPLSKMELENLFAYYYADDYDRDSNDFGEYPVMEINQGLAEKIIAGALPFILSKSHADENGVWFFGPSETERVNILVTYPETDMEPDVLVFSLTGDITKEKLISCINRAIKKLPEDEETDRLTRLDTVIEQVAKKTGCLGRCVMTDYEIEII